MNSYESIVDEIFNNLNKIRTNPAEFALKLDKEQINYKENNLKLRKRAVPVQTREGVQALKECVQFLKTQNPLGSLTFSEGLRRAAQWHINDTGTLGLIGHSGSKETTLQNRVDLFGKWNECIGETLDYGLTTGFESVSDQVIDDGIPSRPHRTIVLNPKFKQVGIAVGRHSQYSRIACCIFAGKFVDSDEMPEVEVKNEFIEDEIEVGEWVENAVRMTCDIRTEEEFGRISKKVQRYWELSDGRIIATD